MPPLKTRGIVAIALGSNVIAAAGKIFAYGLTGSSALLSEAIHSLVSVAHQSLLLFGQKHSQRPADARHPFGYAKELYFWSYAAAVLLFSHGAGVAIYEGVQKLKAPPFLSIAPISYEALVLALVLQGAIAFCWIKGGDEIETPLGGFGLAKDPMRSAIAVENLAAVAGLVIALVGLLATDVFGFRHGDAIASLGVGFVMASVAAFLSLKIKGLIVGEAADPGLRSLVRAILQKESSPGGPIATVHSVRTLNLGSDEVLVAASVQFTDGETARSVEDVTTRLERSIAAQMPEVSHVFLSVQAADSLQSSDVASDSDDEADHAAIPASAAVTPARTPLVASDNPRPRPQGDAGNRKGRKKKRRH